MTNLMIKVLERYLNCCSIFFFWVNLHLLAGDAKTRRRFIIAISLSLYRCCWYYKVSLIYLGWVLSHFNSCSLSQGSQLPTFVPLHYWRAPRSAKKFGRPNWNPLWWVGSLRFSQNWRNCVKLSKLKKNVKKKPCFLKVSWIWFIGLNSSAPTTKWVGSKRAKNKLT